MVFSLPFTKRGTWLLKTLLVGTGEGGEGRSGFLVCTIMHEFVSERAFFFPGGEEEGHFLFPTEFWPFFSKNHCSLFFLIVCCPLPVWELRVALFTFA